MTTTTRRNIIAGAAAMPLLPALAVPVTLPLLPVSAFAAPGNATDYHWQRYHAAKAAFEAANRDHDAMEASFPEHLKISAFPDMPPEGRTDEWRKKVDAWNQSRAELGAEVAGEACEKAAGLVTWPGDAGEAVWRCD
jgi:hypothetical protein